MIATSRVLVPLVLCVILGGCGARKRLAISTCDTHRQRAVLASRYVIVYGTRTSAPGITTYYACLRPGGKALPLGADELGSVYGSDATTGGFRASGTYIAAESSTGEATLAMCARYTNALRCPFAEHWLTVINTKDGRKVRIPLYTSLTVPALVPFPIAVLLSPDGAVAWLQNTTVGAKVMSSLQLWETVLAAHGRSRLAAAPAMIDVGRIDPASLRFERRTLYWTRDREGRHRELR